MDKQMQVEPLQAAAHWYARLGAPDCSTQEQAEFQRWLSSDARHAQAFASVKRSAEAVTRLASDERLAALADAALASDVEAAASAGPRRRWVAMALAASVLCAVIGIRLMPELQMRNTPSLVYRSAPGEARSVQLSDGSSVRLDVGSEIEVQMYKDERRITLSAGRAYFKVAHDVARPFAVTAVGVRTVALGTEFQVQKDEHAVIVTLTEGSVLVSDATADVPSWEEQLLPGDQVRLNEGASTPERRAVNAEHAVSWMHGRHVFEHTPLVEAIAEINRYSERKLRLGDSSLADLQVGGSFVVGDGELIASSIAAALPISVVQAGPKEVILFRRHDQSLH